MRPRLSRRCERRDTLSEWPELRDAVDGELKDLVAELDSVQPLLDKVFAAEPDAIELRAIAATLHAYYNGVERVFVLIAKHFSELPAESHTWHRDLLKQMSTSTDHRPRVISDELRDELSQLLGFRHYLSPRVSDEAEVGSHQTARETSRALQTGFQARSLRVPCDSRPMKRAAINRSSRGAA